MGIQSFKNDKFFEFIFLFFSPKKRKEL